MPLRLGDADDLADLPELDEAILLEELKIRYTDGRIYTYVGDILVALNPFKDLPIYSAEVRTKYQRACLSKNPPHIFAIADSAYQLLLSTGRHQCCVISGESGAGKTESAKLLVSHLIWLSGGRTVLGQKILQVNPLLEAFGNSKTVINNNSSRFGKYLQLKFNGGKVSGAKINEYLLEKSRVVLQNEGEENFHIFYYLFAGLDAAKKEELRLESSSNYQYLQQGTVSSTHSPSEGAERFEEVCNALDLVGFEVPVQASIFTCLAAILHLGNIEFQEDLNEYSYVLEPRFGPIKTVAEFLGVDIKHLIEVLTVNISFTRGEAVRRHWNKDSAVAVRNAIAKALYDRIFRWIVNRINQLLAPTAAQIMEEREIGILDIFGFEKFTENSFEQLCINMANEQLQFFFVEHIFLLEKEEYLKEGVAGSSNIDCNVNKPLLELFFSKPLGILSLLDEQCTFPRANDRSFVGKLNQVLKKKKSPHFVPSKESTSLCFGLIHYAGKVEYSSRGFLDKNRDIMPRAASALLQSSNNDLVRLLFNAAISKTGTLSVNRLTTHRLAKSFRKGLGRDSGRDSGRLGQNQRGGANARPLTVGAHFKNSLQVLIEKLNSANPNFIRCIRPNPVKIAGYFHPETILTQLRYTGMLDTIRIRREGFPVRRSFEEFLDLYGSITSIDTLDSSAHSCDLVLQRAGCEGYKLGRTKVFLKQHHSDLLQREMERVHRAATVLQKLSRGFVERVRFHCLLALKRAQDHKLATFLSNIAHKSNNTFRLQEILCERNVPPSAPPLEFCLPQPPSSPPPPMAPSMTHLLVTPHMIQMPVSRSLPPPPPPPDFMTPLPEPYFVDSGDENLATTDVTCSPLSEDGDDVLLVAPPPDTSYKSFGRRGTRKASQRWFKETQASLLHSPSSGNLPEWFHGILSKREAEEKLSDRSKGTFLVRVCDNRFGYALSVKRGNGSCAHHMISQLEATGKYVVVGESKVHPNLASLLQYYSKNRSTGIGGDILIQPYVQSPTVAAARTRYSADYSSMAQVANSQQINLSRSVSVQHQSDVATPTSHGLQSNDISAAENENGKRRTKLSRTRSHDVGYGALKNYVSQKSPKL